MRYFYQSGFSIKYSNLVRMEAPG